MTSFPEQGFPTNLISLSIHGDVKIYKPLLEWGLQNLTFLTSLSILGLLEADSFPQQETEMMWQPSDVEDQHSEPTAPTGSVSFTFAPTVALLASPVPQFRALEFDDLLQICLNDNKHLALSIVVSGEVYDNHVDKDRLNACDLNLYAA
ncbi:hypothetical protein JRO89_XS15G0185300 [Xanthoceras sorbifolium]|uniref:Uncharacterized protein n=1 Tax=Xanthoceras sorbifolium TaxID=99658 RepID=A0ABQ8H2Y4_9ROSI|nr:hypothetical protein JRO89_XS15G0185300 [Xanthoceras sorbifolium]